jgi:hypothetical protein
MRCQICIALAGLILYPVLSDCQFGAGRKKAAMIPINPDSRSIVLRAPLILLFRVEKVQAGTPAPVPERPLLSRKLDLTIQVLEVLKGEVDEQPGATVQVKVTQYESAISRQGGLPGVWTGQKPEPGVEYIAFSRVATRQSADAVGDAGCERLFPAAEALADLRLAIAEENSGRPVAGALVYSRSVAPQIGYLFAEYISVKTMDESLPDPPTFDAFAQLIETPNLKETPRMTLIHDAYAKVIDSDNPPMEIVYRFAVCLFRVLAIPQAAESRPRILDDLLPGVLRMNSDKPLPAREVFAMRDAQLFQARDVLRKHRAEPGASRLIEWIGR